MFQGAYRSFSIYSRSKYFLPTYSSFFARPTTTNPAPSYSLTAGVCTGFTVSLSLTTPFRPRA